MLEQRDDQAVVGAAAIVRDNRPAVLGEPLRGLLPVDGMDLRLQSRALLAQTVALTLRCFPGLGVPPRPVVYPVLLPAQLFDSLLRPLNLGFDRADLFAQGKPLVVMRGPGWLAVRFGGTLCE